MPYASVNTSILLLRKTTRKSSNLTTFYARAEKIGRKPNGDADIVFDSEGKPRANSDLDTIVAAWNEFQSTGRISAQTDEVFLSSTSVLSRADAQGNRLDYRYHHPSRLKAAAALKSARYPLVSIAEGNAPNAMKVLYLHSISLNRRFFIQGWRISKREPV